MIEIDAHPFLEFRAFSQFKCQFQDKSGKIFGIELQDSAQFDFTEVAQRGLQFDPYRLVETSFLQAPETLYFYNIMKNRLDARYKRGAIVKALAIGSHQKVILEPLTKFMVSMLDAIIETQ